jgi:hypothetical protein
LANAQELTAAEEEQEEEDKEVNMSEKNSLPIATNLSFGV